MGLDNIPVSQRKRSEKEQVPDGFTHKPDEPCPFAEVGQPLGMLGTCCWLRGKAAARELEALGRQTIANRMYENMTDDEALAFASVLATTAQALELEHADDAEKPRGAGWNGLWDGKAKEMIWGTYSTFDEAIAEIRRAGLWYEKVGRLSFGVRAWY